LPPVVAKNVLFPLNSLERIQSGFVEHLEFKSYPAYPFEGDSDLIQLSDAQRTPP